MCLRVNCEMIFYWTHLCNTPIESVRIYEVEFEYVQPKVPGFAHFSLREIMN